jgi:hypothetical protein
MRPVLEYMQFGRDLCLAQREEVIDGIFRRHGGIGIGLKDKRGGRFFASSGSAFGPSKAFFEP